jgi:predicted DNA-binding transcriptional regulator YafY
VRFDYRSRDGEDSQRLVQPNRMVALGRRWYLLAWDVRRDDWRTFRLDRMSRARLAGVRFARREPPGGDAAEFVAQAVQATPRPHMAEVTLACDAAEAEELLRWFDAEVTPAGDECHVVLRAEHPDQLVALVGRLAIRTTVTVHGTDEVVAAVRELGERLLAGAGQKPTTVRGE